MPPERSGHRPPVAAGPDAYSATRGRTPDGGNPVSNPSGPSPAAPEGTGRHAHPGTPARGRTPAEIMALAAAVLAEFAPDRQPPESVRATGEDPWQHTVPATDLPAEVRKAVEAEVAQLGRGTLAVIAAGVDDLAGLAGLAGLPAQLHTPVSAKGLEFDAVVIVDPRATQRLGLLHVER